MATRHIDCRGLYCPEPLIALQREVADAEAGAVIEVLADDPGFADDVEMWTQATGHALEALTPKGDATLARVRVAAAKEQQK